MKKSWNIEISRKMYDALVSMFNVLGMEPPAHIKSEDINRAILQMNTIIQKKTQQTHPSITSQTAVPHTNDTITNASQENTNKKTALIISRIGIIRYQLKNTFNNKGFRVTTIDNPFSGLAEYVKKLHTVVVIDINDNSEDSFAVIKEIKELASHNIVTTNVILLVPEEPKITNNKALTDLVDQVIVKKENWYTRFSYSENNSTYLFK